jgi:hypothetical protein
MNASISPADWRAEVLWLRYREQRELCDWLPDETTKKEQAHRELFAIEEALRADVSESVNALACTIMIEIADETPEEISGLHRTSLAAIRPQLIGGIAEAADRVLATSASSVSAENGNIYIWLDPGVVKPAQGPAAVLTGDQPGEVRGRLRPPFFVEEVSDECAGG